jgi:hypothetical protein
VLHRVAWLLYVHLNSQSFDIPMQRRRTTTLTALPYLIHHECNFNLLDYSEDHDGSGCTLHTCRRYSIAGAMEEESPDT